MIRGIILTAIVAVGALSVSVGAPQQLSQGAVDDASIDQVKGNLSVIKGNTPTRPASMRRCG